MAQCCCLYWNYHFKTFLCGNYQIPLLNNPEVLTSFSCLLATAPIMLFMQKTVSWWGLVTNVLIAPLILPVMLWGFMGIILSLILPALSSVIFLPVTALLDLMIRIIGQLGTLSGSGSAFFKETLVFGLG